ncbi:hypothetical protein [Novosphingobium sp. Leaf2]|uniref:hypothetical protein n=1 Tax=Novosphingobium sp. Leaf2 TaxID=1735670 RepID=UPI0007020CA4|nr:hypothetical protein [Novosphingobium sp. Leaf2]KQM18331.1 hypothetical protein ASE49_08930 [Novosphingobium sp. Leaf2]
MNTAARLAIVGLSASLLLAGCNSGKKQPVAGETDPALAGAMGDQMMVDPQMAGEKGAAVAANGSRITVPAQDRTPEAIAAARKQAVQMAGGAIKPVPAAVQGGAAPLAQGAATAAQVAGQAKIAKTDCSAKVQYSNTWAAKLPAELPVYPRGAVQEAAGIDGQGCDLRVVSYATPVTVDDVIGFYYTRAATAGYGAEHRVDGGDHVLGGRKGSKAYVVYARKAKDGLTEVDLVTSGK